jgi:ubiquinone/menaquinone biosynthesis C-methylase UbiE
MQHLNKDATYTGIDIDLQTIQYAQTKFKDDERTRFFQMKGQELNFSAHTFDLVIIRLVLWAVGEDWKQILSEANRVLQPTGYLYSLEPEDRLLLLLPKNEKRDTHIKHWQDHMFSKGLNPFIGTAVASAMNALPFSEIKTSIHSKAESGLDPDAFKARASNLQKIFMNNNLEINQQMSSDEIEKLESAFLHCTPDSFLVETYIVTTGRKRG